MNLSMEGNSGIFVELLPGIIHYEGPIDLAQYYIKEKNIGKVESKVAVKFTLGRRLLSTFLTTYVPTLLLNIIALSTNYFKVFRQCAASICDPGCLSFVFCPYQ
jgi:hypothetical protein